MTSPDDDPTAEEVYRWVKLCLGNLAGGSGHLASYVLDPASFQLTGQEPSERGSTRYRFVVEGERISEFSGLAGLDAPASKAAPAEPSSEQLEGSIVLDDRMRPDRDAEGLIRIEPFECLHPAAWPASDRAKLPEHWAEHADQDGIDELLDELG